MGSATYLSIPSKFRPLPNRTNVVLTNNINLKLEDSVIIIHDIKEFIEKNKDKEIWIIGGASLYKQFIDLVDEVHHTYILDEFKVDTYFDFRFYSGKFKLMCSHGVCKPEDNGLKYKYEIYLRK